MGTLKSAVSTSLLRLASGDDLLVGGGYTLGGLNQSTDDYLVAAEMVLIEAAFDSVSRDELATWLDSLGIAHGEEAGLQILDGPSAHLTYLNGYFPIQQIRSLEKQEGLIMARPAAWTANTGAVTGQTDASLGADLARAAFQVDGNGVTVGILSDSFDALETGSQNYADDIASGDLPDDVVTLSDLPVDTGASDEGRAMAQIIHDVAPGAGLAFHTAFLGQADFAEGIVELQSEAGAKIIVDDVIYFAEPMFQDGLIAQAIDEVTANGSLYFSSAGNSGRDAAEFQFTDSGLNVSDIEALGPLLDGATSGVYEGDLHDWDTGEGVTPYLQFTVPAESSQTIVVQWDEAFGSISAAGNAAETDIDVYLVNAQTGALINSSSAANIGADPVEFFATGAFEEDTDVQLYLAVAEGDRAPLIRTVFYGYNGNFETVGAPAFTDVFGVGSSYGHTNAKGTIAVGASPYFLTPNFENLFFTAVDDAFVWDFSATIDVPILFDDEGNRLASAERRDGVDIIGPDGGNTTFFGFDAEDDALPNFFGTSASAPNVAAVAALMLSANPLLSGREIELILEETADAVDAATVSFEFFPDVLGLSTVPEQTGGGFVDAVQALAAATSEALVFGTDTGVTFKASKADDTVFALGGDDKVKGRKGDDMLFGGQGDDFVLGNGGEDQLEGGEGNDKLKGGGKDDFLIGGLGNDELFGNRGADIIQDGQGNDLLVGGGGRDLLIVGAGFDEVKGGRGKDTALFSGSQEDYTFVKTGKVITVIGPDGEINELKSVEFIAFSADGYEPGAIDPIPADSTPIGDLLLSTNDIV